MRALSRPAGRTALIVSLALLLAPVPVVVSGTPAAAAPAVCAVFCDTRDPSLAREELFPVGERSVFGRRLVLHVSNVDGMVWGSIDNGTANDSVWLDRSWDGGATWDGLLGRAWIPGGWTGTRTLMYNISDPTNHRRGIIRACGDAFGSGIGCTDWVYPAVCVAGVCDNADPASGPGDHRPVPDAILNGRRIGLHVDNAGMAWGTIDSAQAGDEIWLDRSWDAGAGWPGGSLLGRLTVPSGATSTRTRKYHTSDPGEKLYGGAVRACGRAGQVTCTAWARPSADRPAAGTDALMWGYDPQTGCWLSSWWNSAVTLTTVMDWMKQTGRRDYLWIVNHTFESNRGVYPGGRCSSDPLEGNFISGAIDDAAWWGLAWVRAYDLTGEVRYRDMAVTIANYVASYWDTSNCGGGVWWNRERGYKNAVTNGQYILLTAQLHNRIPGDTNWLNRSRTAWQWFMASGMVNSSNLVNDGLTLSCQNNGQPVWTYNQGLLIGAGVELWRATGDAAILNRARQLADAGTTSPVLVNNGVLTERCDLPAPSCDDNQKQFKGIFMRYLAELNSVTGGAYMNFARTQADTIWSASRDSLNRIGQRWSAGSSNVSDWRTQASGLSALLAAVGGVSNPPPPPPPPPPGGTWAPNVAYPAGATVTYGGATYRCLQPHTSQAGWEPPNVPALWQRL